MAKKNKKKSKKDLVADIEKDIGQAVEKIAGSTLAGKLGEKKKKIPYFYISIIFVIALVCIFAYAMLRTPGIKIGDKVDVTFAGTFENGTKFDEGTFEFRMGENEVIPGFEYGIIGMKEGEEKKFTIEPRYAYGEWNTGNLEVINATYTINRWFDLMLDEISDYTDDEIYIGNTVKINNYMWLVKVTDIDRQFGEARFEHVPVEGSTYYNPLLVWWPIRILEIQNTTIIIRHEPKIGTTAVSREGKTGTVINADEESIVIDYNHKMAGKTLVFDVKINKITRS